LFPTVSLNLTHHPLSLGYLEVGIASKPPVRGYRGCRRAPLSAETNRGLGFSLASYSAHAVPLGGRTDLSFSQTAPGTLFLREIVSTRGSAGTKLCSKFSASTLIGQGEVRVEGFEYLFDVLLFLSRHVYEISGSEDSLKFLDVLFGSDVYLVGNFNNLYTRKVEG